MSRTSLLAVIQGAYFVLTGVWPLVSLRTFEAVTGPKVDDWLVKTVAVLIVVVGSVLILAGVGATSPSRSPSWPSAAPSDWRESTSGTSHGG